MKRCHEASLSRKDSCPGIGYYQFLSDKFDEIYIRYNNGVEGKRISGEWRADRVIERIPPPVPNYGDDNGNGKWHYFTLKDTPDEYRDVSQRTVDDFCPIVRLKKFVADAVNPEVSCHKNS